jgi:diguanylate cyclase (GGDEF)-like protein
MGGKGSKNTQKNGIAFADTRVETLDQRVFELTSLLKAVRTLSNILNPLKLYSVFSDILREKIRIRMLAIVIYHEETETFELVFNHGLGDLNFEFKREEGLLWQNILENEPFAVTDALGNPLFREFFEKCDLDKLGSKMWVPLIMRGKVIGLLMMGEKINGQPFDDFDMEFLKQISTHASICINTCRLYVKREKEKEDLDRTLYILSLLYDIARAMTYITDLKSLLKYILSQAIKITKAEKGSIMLYDSSTDLLKIRVLIGLEDKEYQEKVNNDEIECKSFKPGQGVAGKVFQTGKAMIINNTEEDNRFVESDSSFVRSISCIPMAVYKDVIGVINVTNKQGEEGFSEQDAETLKAVADQAAVAVNKAQLWELAVTDSLTGLYIRRYFMAKFDEEFHRSKRYKKLFSIVMADLDKFKKINDVYGHTTGDLVLKTIGKFLQKNMRDVDIIARYGGDEFVMILPETDKDEAYSFAERLRERVSQIKLENLPKLTISLGIASYPVDEKNIEGLIKNADAAMYSAKQTGRNKVIKYSSDIDKMDGGVKRTGPTK